MPPFSAPPEISEQSGPQAAALDDPEALASELRQRFRSLGLTFVLSQMSEDAQEPQAAQEPSAAELAEQKELIEKVSRALAHLPPQESELIRMHYHEGLSLTDCGARLGLHKSWISRLHARAIESLKKLLESPLPDTG